MPQNWRRLEIRAGDHWRSLQLFPDPVAGIKEKHTKNNEIMREQNKRQKNDKERKKVQWPDNFIPRN